jgi:hypothetical protein
MRRRACRVLDGVDVPADLTPILTKAVNIIYWLRPTGLAFAPLIFIYWLRPVGLAFAPLIIRFEINDDPTRFFQECEVDDGIEQARDVVLDHNR